MRVIPIRCLFLAGVLMCGACGPLFDDVEPACEGWRPGDVVFTELLPDPEGTDTGQEWMELHNPGRSAMDLRGLLLYAARADGSQERAYLFEESVPVAPRGHVVLGDVRSESLPAHVNHSYGDVLGSLGNSGGLVGLRCGSVVVDEVRYSGPLRSGVARIYDGRLVPDAVDNDEAGRWCDAPASSSDGGTRASPGAANPPCAEAATDGGVPAGSCLSSRTGVVRSLSRPRPGDLVITEIMADPKAVADAQGEWVEVYALRDVDLNGVTLANEGSGRALLGDSRCLELKAGTHGVLARSADPSLNGGLPSVLGIFAFGLSNGQEPHALRLSLDETLLDEVSWTSAATPGVSRQLDPSRRDATRNDAPEGFCPTPKDFRFGLGDQGTPGAENRPCT
ncbi:lamin tail domain-containing protein [Archangium violaceum]|uniref:lamin tail domain-containing protein n=1 Tax=Archangium violaceum TaxID=83451 RepID=UPI002B286F0B|nr:lamin tail domain-containing protein [Archangium gephyra]